MKGTTHMAVGTLTGGLLLATALANQSMSLEIFGYTAQPILITMAAAIGGLAPDVDMAKSRAGSFLRKLLKRSILLAAFILLGLFFAPEIPFLQNIPDIGVGVNRGILIIFAAFCIALLVIIEKAKHRGFTHTLAGLLLIASPFGFMAITGVIFPGANLVFSAQMGFVIGWFSHMAIDTLNPKGVPWLWPIIKYRFKIIKITTGSSGEDSFLVVSTILFIMVYGLIFISF